MKILEVGEQKKSEMRAKLDLVVSSSPPEGHKTSSSLGTVLKVIQTKPTIVTVNLGRNRSPW